MPIVKGLDHIALTVTDPAEAAAWCEQVLGLVDAFPGRWGGVPRMMLSPGGQDGLGTGIALFPPRKGAAWEGSGEQRLSHVAFRCTRGELAGWRSHLGRLGIHFSEEDHEVSHSIYFRGPDGVLFEVTAYE